MSIKKSVFSRSIELAKMSVKVGLNEIRSGNLQSRLEQAKIITQSLSQLKGAAMKAGQLISIEMAEYFPPEAVEILSQLQNNATSVSYDIIEKILIKELGSENYKKLKNISNKPVASASIAQIHTADWEQKKLALKIQHPGVAESIDSDLAIIQKLATAFCGLTQRDMNLNPLFNELKEVLHQEVDFLQEAELLKLYKSKLLTLKANQDFYFAPSVIDSLTTKKILAMTWEDGDNLNQWILQNPSMKSKEQLAHLLLNLYCHEFFDWGVVQTDPNFSNFLIRKVDNQIGLVLLDFGSTRQYDRKMINEYVDLLKAVQGGIPKEILKSAYEFGLIDQKESDEAKNLFIQMMDLAIEPFRINKFESNLNGKSFDFANTDYSKRSQTVIASFIKNLKYSPPPHRIIFLHRKLGGIFSLLKRLDVKINISPYWELMIEKHN